MSPEPPPLPPRPEPILRVSGLQRDFGKFQAVDDLDLTVNRGEIYGFLGVNGAGKTTTVRMLLGIIAPSGGEIELFGETTKRTTLKQKQRIGYVSQEQVFHPWMNATMLGKFVGGLYPTWDKEEYFRLLKVLEVPTDRKASQLSGGMRMKLALALALAPRPELLILDEPTAGLDPVARREFLEIIQHQSRDHGRTIFFSTHLLDEVERTADRIGIIHRGKKRFEGGLGELQDRVRKVKALPDGLDPESFEIWRTEEDGALIVEASPVAWTAAQLETERLTLDDIFIACVGIETTRL